VRANTVEQASELPAEARMAATDKDALYAEAIAAFGPALERLAGAYEPDRDRRGDLLQEIHVALWRSFAGFDGRCSLRTWVYRVAHNTATSLVSRARARTPALVGLEEVEARAPGQEDWEQALDERRALARLTELVQRLKPLDRQIILLYLEGVDAAAIGEITGLSAGNVATKVHRIKRVLARSFSTDGIDHE
jgi:RNA polymerase sigma-70 factor (ECF subfamily)